jgi:hypothetical protein
LSYQYAEGCWGIEGVSREIIWPKMEDCNGIVLVVI